MRADHEAIAHYRKALEIKPDYAEAHYNLGIALQGADRSTRLSPIFRRHGDQARLRQGPLQPRHHSVLGRERSPRRSSTGARPSACGRTSSAWLNQLAWVLATCPEASVRNGAEAVELAQRAVRLSGGREPAILGTLAAAYAEAGRFPEAVQTARKALELATQQNKQALAESIKAKIPLYEAGTPFREPHQPSPARSTTP